MKIGLVGKPNVGKSTFFSSSTLATVDIANYPFCTIDPNIGVAYVRARCPCPCKQLRERLENEGRILGYDTNDERQGSLCEPRTGFCVNHQRYIPVQLVDVAGLVPGAHAGRGRGNAFLSDLSNCDALIHIFDASGSTDIEGQFLGFQQPYEQTLERSIQEIAFLEEELDSWIFQLLAEGWSRGTRRVQSEGERGFGSFLLDKLSGIGAQSSHVNQTIQDFTLQGGDISTPWALSKEDQMKISMMLRQRIFPIVYAGNKCDKSEHIEVLKQDLPIDFTPCLADLELALRRATESRIIQYTPGESSFTISDESTLSEPQQRALEQMQLLLQQHSSTGVLPLLEKIVFEILEHVVVYPVQDENHWIDGEQRVLPDAFLVESSSTCKEMAYKVHSDLGDGFIRAIHGVTKRTIGADYIVQDNDVIKIHSK